MIYIVLAVGGALNQLVIMITIIMMIQVMPNSAMRD